MSEYGLGTEALLAREGRPNQEDFKLGGPRCCCTVPGRGHRTEPSGPWAIQVIQSRAVVSVPRGIGLTEALARAGSPSQVDFKLGCPRCCCTVTAAVSPSWRDRTQSPKHWRVRAVPVRKTSSWAAPAAQAVAPYLTSTGQGHRPAGHYTVRGHGPGRHHDQTHRSPGTCGPSQSG